MLGSMPCLVGCATLRTNRFLIERCTQSIELANFFHWYLCVEKYDKVKGAMFADLHEHFRDALRRVNPTPLPPLLLLLSLYLTPDSCPLPSSPIAQTAQGKEWERILTGQGTLVNQLVALSENAKSARGKVKEKAERLKQLLHPEKGEFRALKEFEPVQYVYCLAVACLSLVSEARLMCCGVLCCRRAVCRCDRMWWSKA
jgi:hypothetical protein